MTRFALPERSRSSAALLLRLLLIAVIVGAVLAVLGPFGSYMNGGVARRALYWIGAMVLGLALYGAAFWIVKATTSAASRLWWPALIAATSLVSVPQALATRAAAFWLWPELGHLGLSNGLWFAQTATLGLLMMLGTAFALRSKRQATLKAPSASAPTDAPSLGKDVLALQMEDHYVRVHRAHGSDLILMPLGRAIARVEAEGLKTHRSWWVASHAVVRVEGTARSMRLHLTNGVVAPVARSAVLPLKAAGWLTDPVDESGVSAIPRNG